MTVVEHIVGVSNGPALSFVLFVSNVQGQPSHFETANYDTRWLLCNRQISQTDFYLTRENIVKDFHMTKVQQNKLTESAFSGLGVAASVNI